MHKWQSAIAEDPGGGTNVLRRVMELTGLKTRKDAIDYALSQAERAAKMAKLFARPRRTKDELKGALDPKYDLTMLREREKPQA